MGVGVTLTCVCILTSFSSSKSERSLSLTLLTVCGTLFLALSMCLLRHSWLMSLKGLLFCEGGQRKVGMGKRWEGEDEGRGDCSHNIWQNNNF